MTVPRELRQKPPPETLRWVAGQVGNGAEVVRVRRLPNAWASAVHAVDVLAGKQRHPLVLRRWARPELPPDPGIVENEAAVLSALAATELPVPRLVAVDADARATDVPAVLMTRVRGRGDLAPASLDRYIAALADALHAVQAVSASLDAYDPWIDDVEIPPQTRVSEVWSRAIEIAQEPYQPARTVLCHRDFHPGNVLWTRGRLTGVVDWSHACTGAPAADVAHCRLNLALLFGLEAADAFATAYGPVDDLARFDVEHTVSAYGVVDALWRFHDAGRADLTTTMLSERRDAFLVDAVKRCG
jgi:aminoglycoside phosphotransferase (APT) family kinase protein